MKNSIILKHFKYVLLGVLMAALISILTIKFVFTAYRVDGDSMLPTLRHRDRVIIARMPLLYDHIERFDIVIFSKPGNWGHHLVKRVIGLPGETVEIRGGRVYIDSRELPQPFLQIKGSRYSSRVDVAATTIKAQNYFLVGDNRGGSLDSRIFGAVPSNRVFGKVIFRYWPPSRIGNIK